MVKNIYFSINSERLLWVKNARSGLFFEFRLCTSSLTFIDFRQGRLCGVSSPSVTFHQGQFYELIFL